MLRVWFIYLEHGVNGGKDVEVGVKFIENSDHVHRSHTIMTTQSCEVNDVATEYGDAFEPLCAERLFEAECT